MALQASRNFVQGTLLVVGGGISGMTVAIEAAEAGLDAHIVESSPSLGGRVAQLHKYFPKLCPPVCGLEINLRRLRANPRVHVHTLTTLQSLSGSPGDFEAVLLHAPRFVNDRCTACNACVDVCPVDRENNFDFGMSRTKAIYLPHPLAHPQRYAVDPAVCKRDDCAECVKVCPVDAIDLGMKPTTTHLHVGAVVIATGWKPYDASRLTNLGFGVHKNVVTNMMFERMASPTGPTGGLIQRPSDNKPPRSVVFVQCAGSRDENHLPYCSGVCCLASLKQTTYVRDQIPDASVRMFYIDIRSPGRLEDFFRRAQGQEGVTFDRGKVARVTAADDHTVRLTVEDTLSGVVRDVDADLVVLATGLVPSVSPEQLPMKARHDEAGFGVNDPEGTGIIFAGCAKRPLDVSSSVQDATGAALRAIQSNTRRASHG